MIYSKIAGTGRYLPEKILTNADLEKLVDTTDEWIRTRTGVERRHVASEDQTTSDLCVEAAKKAMESANVTADDIDLIIVGTTSPDLIFPNIATIIQDRMGIHGCPAFSIEAACTGFIYALSTADKFVRAGEAKCALIIGAEIITKLIDWSDRSTCVLFGDGAGAVIVKPSDEPGIISTHLGADGQYRDLLYYPVGASKDLAKAGLGDSRIIMKGNEVFKVAVKTLGNVAEQALKANNIDKNDLDWLVPHQANLRIIQATAKRLKLPMDKVIQTVQDHGNTSAASVPMALDVAVRDGRIQRGHLILLEAFGGGFTWGSVLMRY
ncbi:MAG: 3-oxoacyl-ACP synthase [Gammaproteobacteria bacterium]|nr:MAG: 3-oxoacyl-ACP synthase [Gammaproteobacteria bacterium]RLA36727.1 MAG: 3-oxoacyl-ACP synthase [Gammaproteobacteria bacterium]